MILPASYSNGFAPRDGQPLYPELWRGCVGAWNPGLGPTGLTLRDWSGFGNHGTLTNMDAGSDWLTNGGRYALDFDGTNDYVSLGNNLTQKGEVTAAAWINLSSVAASLRGVISCSNPFADALDYFLGVNRTAGKIEATWGGSIIATSATTLVANRWYHVAIVRSGTTGSWTGSVYIDGRLDVSASTSVNPSAPAGSETVIGRVSSLAGLYFPGLIDDVAIHSRAMSASSIRLLASRRGIAYDLAPRRRSRIFTGGFKAYWAARKAQIIGGGL